MPIRHNPDSSSSSPSNSSQHSGLTDLLQLPADDLAYAKLLLTSLEDKLTSFDEVGLGGMMT